MPSCTAAYEGAVRLGRPLLEAWLVDAEGSGGMYTPPLAACRHGETC